MTLVGVLDSPAFMNFLSSISFRKKWEKPLSWRAAMLDFLTDVVVIFAIVLLVVKPFFFAPFQVQQDSMLPNVLDGEYIIVWKLPYLEKLGWREYQRNDVVVFRPTNKSDIYLIKRVIGLPGETVRFSEGGVWIAQSGEAKFRRLEENFLSPENDGNTCLATNFCSATDKAEDFEVVVPRDSYFVLGDNRLRSRDSRTCFQGRCDDLTDRFLTKSEIEGRALVVFARIWQTNGSDTKTHFSLRAARLLSSPVERFVEVN